MYTSDIHRRRLGSGRFEERSNILRAEILC